MEKATKTKDIGLRKFLIFGKFWKKNKTCCTFIWYPRVIRKIRLQCSWISILSKFAKFQFKEMSKIFYHKIWIDCHYTRLSKQAIFTHVHTRTSSGFHNNGAWKRDFPLLRAISEWSTYYLANLLIYRVKVRAFKQNIRNFFLLGVHITGSP